MKLHTRSRVIRSLCCLLGILAMVGCSRTYDGKWNPPLLYKIDIQQGNVVSQAMLDKLKPGLDKQQVRFIIGSPILVSPFDTERWDYLYSYQVRGGIRRQRHISLQFEDGKLAGISGDVRVPGWDEEDAAAADPPADVQPTESQVPEKEILQRDVTAPGGNNE